jgi:hypothetical protein
MADALATYVHDHLAGAQFAVSMLEDLRDKASDARLRELARQLLPPIEEDRQTLQELADRLGEGPSAPKETAAWLAQKASRLKLAPDDPLGAFEIVEMVCVGVLGKLSLWHALKAVAASDPRVASLDLDGLAERAKQQHGQAERVRLALAPAVLGDRAAAPAASA